MSSQPPTTDDEVLECVNCGKRTIRIEAESRIFNTGFCGYCGYGLEPIKESSTDDAAIEAILDKLQARDFYDAVQAIEVLGASEDFTKSVVAVGNIGRKFGSHISTREQAKAAIKRLLLDGQIAELEKVPQAKLDEPYGHKSAKYRDAGKFVSVIYLPKRIAELQAERARLG